MPMSRYEIRNEYSLADPDLYRAADKDDPEALLEGVAMAGLVGVLRQLGDLAEFAADVFHNLHEEVMATAARGHGLMTRVQQLETEVPSIEKAFLSQTDHSSFFNHAGVGWHPSLRIDQNLVTQGDLPRFIMDSYEECRAPPRLFLLDKFDVAGAGACLKRYTDPSFFKVETSGMTRSDVQREKKIRKGKKKGPRWRNGENPEVLSTSHTKLHQLFLEEHVENGVSNPSRRVKLKRRLNGFPFDSKSGKTYMEKFLRSPMPDHKVLHEVAMNSSSLMLDTNGHNESGLEFRPVSPDRESMGSKRSPPSPDREEIMMNPSMYKPSGVPTDDKISELANSYPSLATDDISSSLDEVSGEKVIAVDTERNREGSLTGYQSDDIASEVDNYVDAPSTMESEMDTDSELRGKSDFTSSHKKTQPLISEGYDEHLHTQSPDSQSTGGSIVSEKGSTSSRNEMSSFSSDSQSTASENPQPEKNCAKGFLSADDIPKNEIFDASSYQRTADELSLADQHSKPVISDDTRIDMDATTNHRSDFELLNSSLCSDESVPNSAHSESGVVGRKSMSMRSESDEEVNTLDDEEKKTNLVMEPPCSPSVSDFTPQSEGDSSRSSSASEHIVAERNGEILPSLSTVPDIHSLTSDSPVEVSLGLLHEDESDREDHNMAENIAPTSDMFSQNTDGTTGMISSEDLIPSELDDKLPKLPENSLSDHPDISHYGNIIMSTVSKEEYQADELDNKDSNVSADSPKRFPLAYSEARDAEDNQISSENSIMLHLPNSPDWLRAGVDAHDGDVIPEKEMLLNESIVQTPNDSEALENSRTLEDLEQPARKSDIEEMDAIIMCTSSTGREITEISGSDDLKSISEVQALLDDSDSEEPKANTADMVSAMPAISSSVTIDKVDLPVGLNKLGEENIEDSGMDEFENDKSSLSGSRGESGLVETVDQTEAATSASGSVLCNTIDNDPSISEASDTVPNSHLDLEADHCLEVVHAATVQSLVDQSGLDRRPDFFQQNGLQNHISDASSLQVDYDAEESEIQERAGSPPSRPDQELLQSAEIIPELSSVPSVDLEQTLDHDHREVDNNSASLLSLVDSQSPPSVSELHIGFPGYVVDPLDSIFPPVNPFSNTNQIDLADLPPLPPLPPVQWRMTKLQHASSSTEGQIMKHKGLFPQLISPITAPTNDVGSPQPTISTDDVDSSQPNESTNDVCSSPPISFTDIVGSSPSNISTVLDSSPPTASTDNVGSFPLTASTDVGSLPLTASTDVGSLPLTAPTDDMGSSAPTTSTDDVGSSPLIESANDVSSSLDEVKHSVIQIAPETASKEEKAETSSSTVGADIIHEKIDLPPKIENKDQHFVVPPSASELPSPSEEDGVTNISQTVKLPRPRNPLVDDVAALDKSKLRKVTERVRPQIQKVDERDSILEQIRTKSFNLKPAIASRPSTRGPNTNLRVAAILEKANAIRQAFAGSDEDDEDSWSDS